MKGSTVLFDTYFLAIYCIIGMEMCDSNQFACEDGTCIPISLRCNDAFDCPFPDTSDEFNCPTSPNKCREGLFECPDGSCINPSNENCSDITTAESTLTSTSSNSESASSTQDYYTSYASTKASSTSNSTPPIIVITPPTIVTTPPTSHTDVTTIPTTTPKAGIIPDEDNDDTGVIVAAVICPILAVIILICLAFYIRYRRSRKGSVIINYVRKRCCIESKKDGHQMQKKLSIQ